MKLVEQILTLGRCCVQLKGVLKIILKVLITYKIIYHKSKIIVIVGFHSRLSLSRNPKDKCLFGSSQRPYINQELIKNNFQLTYFLWRGTSVFYFLDSRQNNIFCYPTPVVFEVVPLSSRIFS